MAWGLSTPNQGCVVYGRTVEIRGKPQRRLWSKAWRNTGDKRAVEEQLNE